MRSELKERLEVLFAMWDNEKIFSVGDLSGSREEYNKFIHDEYDDSYLSRLIHIELMVERLFAESNMINDLIEHHPEIIK